MCDVAILYKKIKVYPNLAGDFISILFSDQVKTPVEVAFFNLSGRLINKVLIDPKSNQIDISNLPPGVYFIRMIVGHEAFIQKFVKS